ncbi:hypothetical protein TBLA_0E04330 [Henningerozyma blattae CBS 6284]|uniref:NOT2/NOT3/NOT5 C-terminal domain-containing protein n=1 Tax=Henningerozyma blattae (strain ATCC 34711 / CBS 6284 / DSM 70876 / NBRC 10599 / NRRL Y-10934 / UCD 77-7) TaxID=1071380 RepID=I2H535_HENB6|nr:hypothetical protein TBLA_0E04330 [Tetrapisispora blattae CBS 6284]CCH61487.1 hypothetical protein TBLA_0E04330 [Tetrapisispora blattae CBS 6284]
MDITKYYKEEVQQDENASTFPPIFINSKHNPTLNSFSIINQVKNKNSEKNSMNNSSVTPTNLNLNLNLRDLCPNKSNKINMFNPTTNMDNSIVVNTPISMLSNYNDSQRNLNENKQDNDGINSNNGNDVKNIVESINVPAIFDSSLKPPSFDLEKINDTRRILSIDSSSDIGNSPKYERKDIKSLYEGELDEDDLSFTDDLILNSTNNIDHVNNDVVNRKLDDNFDGQPFYHIYDYENRLERGDDSMLLNQFMENQLFDNEIRFPKELQFLELQEFLKKEIIFYIFFGIDRFGFFKLKAEREYFYSSIWNMYTSQFELENGVSDITLLESWKYRKPSKNYESSERESDNEFTDTEDYDNSFYEQMSYSDEYLDIENGLQNNYSMPKTGDVLQSDLKLSKATTQSGI